MLDIREITFDCFLANVGAMLEAHRHELYDMDLKPNIGLYRKMESDGVLLIVSAWYYDLMIGYSVNFVIPHHHNVSMVYCSNDLLYLDPEYRHGSTGIKLIAETERIAKERGAKWVYWRAIPGTPLETILVKRGCKTQETVFKKVF